jgi:signal peptidase II
MKSSHYLAMRFLPILAALVWLDLWTKHLITASFRYRETKAIIPGFLNLVLAHNTGAAFSMGNRLPKSFFLVSSFLAVGVVVYLLLKLKPEEHLSRWGLVLILSGAIGNIVDRIRLGYVVDFIEVYYKTFYWPAFNVADSAITVGAILFGLELLLHKKRSTTT